MRPLIIAAAATLGLAHSDAKGRPVMVLKSLIAADYGDAYAKDCTMPQAN